VILDFLAADAVPPLARSILSIHPSVCVCLSVTSRGTTTKTVIDRPMVTMGSLCHHRATQGTHLQPPTTTPSPKLGAHNPSQESANL